MECNPIEVLRGERGPIGPQGPKGDTGDGFLTLKYTLTATQIKTLNSVPVTIIPAPGAGKAIVCFYAGMNYKRGTISFSTGASQFNFLSDLTNFNAQLVSQSFIDGSQSCFPIAVLVNVNDTQIIENTPLYVRFDNGDSTVGNGTVDVYITYQIIIL